MIKLIVTFRIGYKFKYFPFDLNFSIPNIYIQKVTINFTQNQDYILVLSHFLINKSKLIL